VLSQYCGHCRVTPYHIDDDMVKRLRSRPRGFGDGCPSMGTTDGAIGVPEGVGAKPPQSELYA